MAIFEKETPRKVLLDDTEELKCVIENWRTVNGHTEFIIRVQRGPLADNSWRISKRYNDFHKLHTYLQTSGIQLDFPPKKFIGNFQPEFLHERQRALQKYLNKVMMNPILVSSLPARSFIDPANYCQAFSEHALQHVSLAVRGEVGWEVVGPLTEIGWRLRKHYYHLKHKSNANIEYWGSWTDYGPDKYLDEKDMHSIFKSLNQIQHPYIHAIDLCLCTDIGGLVVRQSHKNGSLRDLLCNSKPKMSFLKKYGNPKGHKGLEIDQVALYGRQILEALRFLHEKGLPYGHLHSGNVVIDTEKERIKLLDIENGILGVPSFYRPYFMQHRKICNLEAIDVYCFGHTLYEMTFGAPLHESIADHYPECNSPTLITILESILSSEGCKSGLPTIESLLNNPFFAKVHLNIQSGEKAHLKIGQSVKEKLKFMMGKIEERLKDEQKMIRSQKRLVKVQEMMSSEEEKKKQRHKQKQFLKEQARQKSRDHPDCHLTKSQDATDRCDSVTSSGHTSQGTATPPSTSGPSPQPPPPPAPPIPPPPPVGLPPPPTINGDISNGSSGADSSRNALLGAICNFNKSNLRKTKI